MTVKLNDSYKKKKERIKKLPIMGTLAISGMRKKDAADLIKIFHDGIKKDSFGLAELAESTIKSKRKMGYSKPDVPLYGKGDEDKKRTYSNMLRMSQLKNGWKVFASLGKHHKSNLKLRQLLKLHETGYTFKVKGKMIRVPPRPAWMLSVRLFLQELKRKQTSTKIKKEITKFINTGNDKWFKDMSKIFYGKYKDLIE